MYVYYTTNIKNVKGELTQFDRKLTAACWREKIVSRQFQTFFQREYPRRNRPYMTSE